MTEINLLHPDSGIGRVIASKFGIQTRRHADSELGTNIASKLGLLSGLGRRKRKRGKRTRKRKRRYYDSGKGIFSAFVKTGARQALKQSIKAAIKTAAKE